LYGWCRCVEGSGARLREKVDRRRDFSHLLNLLLNLLLRGALKMTIGKRYMRK
jgi:hypothetical protein